MWKIVLIFGANLLSTGIRRLFGLFLILLSVISPLLAEETPSPARYLWLPNPAAQSMPIMTRQVMNFCYAMNWSNGFYPLRPASHKTAYNQFFFTQPTNIRASA